jgi:ribonuclease E
MKKEMLINVLQPEECRIAIVEDGILDELYVERTSHESYTGNIYKGKIVNLEPAIQAAFVDFSVGRNGFLHISDVEPQYYRRLLADDAEPAARDRHRAPRAAADDAPRSRRPPAEGQGRSRDRERPDLMERGRRDRSEPHRFGEGLTDEEEDEVIAPPPPPRLPEPAPPEEPRRAWVGPPDVSFWSEEPPLPTPPSARDRETRPILPEEPRARVTPPVEPLDIPDLPPSRTQRGRTSAPPAFEPPEPEGRAAPPTEPRAPRSRGSRRRSARPQLPEPEIIPESEIEPEPPREAEPERERERSAFDPASILPSFIEPPPEVPRPRGRAAIRSRSGERGPTPERPRPSSPQPLGGAIEPERSRARGRAAEPEPETPRERFQPHARAGEPGYVPRRERERGFEPRSDESEITPLSREEFEPLEAEGRPDGTRRRRRRRRRDRPEREMTGAAPTAPLETEPFDRPRPRSLDREMPPFGRAATTAGLREEDFDFGDESMLAEREELAEPDEEIEVEAPRVEEEIEPELEEEIRREVEEIYELERELGLRPPRGEEREFEAGRLGHTGRGRGLPKPPIQEVFRRGDEVLVQVIKESIGTKGPTLSTYISIPGRYLVLMPGLNRVGVSRKIADDHQRRKLRQLMHELNPPKGLGFIVRTAGLDRTKRELAKDLAYLLRLWKVILRRIKKAKAPAPIYQESDMITRTIRDIFTPEIDTIWIDERSAFERAQEFLRVVMPRYVNRLKFYDEKVPLFHKYGIEEEIAKIQRRRVDLPEGGSIVIEQTEALVAIDVNSGNFRVENDAERTAYEMNLRAAKEIARQLRLRDLGGVIINDFIDMREERHCRGVERALREAIKRDRARTKVLRMSAFGIIEMTRQRIRPSLRRSIYEDCAHCNGAGVAKTAESMAIDVMRLLALAGHREEIRRVNVCVAAPVATYLNNRKRREIARIEAESQMTIHIRHEEGVPAEHLQIDCFDSDNNEVRLLPPAPVVPPRRGR